MKELVPVTAHTDEKIKTEKHFLENYSRDRTGRYVVRLPFKTNTSELGTSRYSPLYRLNSAVKSMKYHMKRSIANTLLTYEEKLQSK